MSASEKEPGSVKMKSERLERFARILGETDGGLTLVEAWIQSDPAEVKPKVTPGRRVSASKAGKRVADRVAFIKQKNASTAPTASLTAERLTTLMSSVTASLLSAADAANRAGSNAIAQQLRKAITVHAGRSVRLGRRSPALEQNADEIDIDGVLERLHYCKCSGAI